MYDLREVSPIWQAYTEAFGALFSPNIIDESEVEIEAERLYPHRQEISWDWYVRARCVFDRRSDDHFIERILGDYLFGEDPRRLIYLHGHTGAGKSTLIRYFFAYYIPFVFRLNPARLAKLVLVKIPLSYMNGHDIELEWDARVCDFLYREFPELESPIFLQNLARHILYPSNGMGRSLVMGPDGVLRAEGYTARFINDVEARIQRTFSSVDPESVISWLDDDISPVKGLSVGKLFNSNVIQLLAAHYNYEFVFIVDNIDDIPSEIQFETCRLVKQKMQAYAPYANTRFIIATRDNFLEPVMTETLPISAQFHHSILRLPPLPFGDVLRLRKTVFFDPLREKGDRCVRLQSRIFIQVEYLEDFLEAVFTTFDNVQQLTQFYRLCNNNTRRMLDIVRTAFESPHIDIQLLSDAIRAATKEGESVRKAVAQKFAASHRVVDLLVRGTNRIIDVKSKIHLPNIYFSGSANHYSSTLCRPFLLAMVVNESSISYTIIEKNLLALGHPKELIASAAQSLLNMQLVFSAQGFRLPQDREGREKMVFEHRDLPFGRYLLYELANSLVYLQGMAYVTPLEVSFRNRIVLAEKVGDPVAEVRDRIGAASALYQQLSKDVLAQIQFINSNSECDRLWVLFGKYGLGEIISEIREHIIEELTRIAKSNPELVHGISFSNFFPKIKVTNSLGEDDK